MEFGPKYITHNKLTVSQFYIIELESPSEINKLITMVYNTSVDPLLY